MKTTLYEKGNRIALYATVKNISTGTSTAGKKQVVLTLEDNTPVFFTDREEGRGLATRIGSMKMKEGSSVLIDATKSENGNGLMGNNIVYRGHVITIKDGDNDIYVIVSGWGNKRDWGAGNLEFSVPLYSRDLNGDEWVKVNMFSSNKNTKDVRALEAKTVGIIAHSFTEKEWESNGKKGIDKSYVATSVVAL